VSIARQFKDSRRSPHTIIRYVQGVFGFEQKVKRCRFKYNFQKLLQKKRMVVNASKQSLERNIFQIILNCKASN
jgi:hypothetical protein